MLGSQANGLSHEHVVDIILDGRRAKYNRFWHDLGTAYALVYKII
jgi:hypothetical protein